MPYIPEDRREQIRPSPYSEPHGPGELNYCITDMAIAYLRRNGPVNYRLLNEIMGVMGSAQQEFYRRVVVPYEDSKKIENGDVYPRQGE